MEKQEKKQNNPSTFIVSSKEIAANGMVLSPKEIMKRKKEGTWKIVNSDNQK